jgi:hypothetical protein
MGLGAATTPELDNPSGVCEIEGRAAGRLGGASVTAL